jgi:hypothetical protein
MPTILRQKLSELASSFVRSVLRTIREASIEELAETPGRAPAPPASSGGRRRPGGARLGRRSAGDIAKVIDRIAALLRQSPKGLRAEQIRQRLGLQAKELPRPLKEGFQAGRLGKSGAKRATTYVLKGAAPSAAGPASFAKASKSRRPRPGSKTAAKKKK